VLVTPLDVADPAAALKVAEQVRQRFGRCDILINNAAVHYDTWEGGLAQNGPTGGFLRDGAPLPW
jgi:NAD(P)-dependent dehydrogenase (short-subunit alcohol dehydrogenase family)